MPSPLETQAVALLSSNLASRTNRILTSLLPAAFTRLCPKVEFRQMCPAQWPWVTFRIDYCGWGISCLFIWPMSVQFTEQRKWSIYTVSYNMKLCHSSKSLGDNKYHNMHVRILTRHSQDGRMKPDHITSLPLSVSSVAQSQPHGLQHARLPCSSPTPRACSNLCPSSWWYLPQIPSKL